MLVCFARRHNKEKDIVKDRDKGKSRGKGKETKTKTKAKAKRQRQRDKDKDDKDKDLGRKHSILLLFLALRGQRRKCLSRPFDGKCVCET